MRKIITLAALASLAVIAACSRTEEGDLEVQRPTVGTTTDTLDVPSVDVGTEQETLTVTRPTVDVNRDRR